MNKSDEASVLIRRLRLLLPAPPCIDASCDILRYIRPFHERLLMTGTTNGRGVGSYEMANIKKLMVRGPEAGKRPYD